MNTLQWFKCKKKIFTKQLSSFRVIVTILLSWGTCSWHTRCILMSMISWKSQKVCHSTLDKSY